MKIWRWLTFCATAYRPEHTKSGGQTCQHERNSTEYETTQEEDATREDDVRPVRVERRRLRSEVFASGH